MPISFISHCSIEHEKFLSSRDMNCLWFNFSI
uniref:Uncharacterized protein n=1 Tax=Arundo donax TaxID=35708 RepID=A0A0A9BPK5_ARUDO